MIKLSDVSLEFENKVILDSVSLKIKKGETFVILGPSGAGKSSILKIICGLWKPDSGSLSVDGFEYSKLNKKELRKIQQKLGMVFQGNALFDSLSVTENIGYFISEDKTKTEQDVQKIVDQVLAFVNMEGTGSLRIDQLSGGMKKRVAIARALAFDPNILLFDEPTTGLDPINSRIILELIDKIRDSGKTSVVVTHILSDAFAIASRLAMVKNGSIIECGDKKTLLCSKNTFIREFVGYDMLNMNALEALKMEEVVCKNHH